MSDYRRRFGPRSNETLARFGLAALLAVGVAAGAGCDTVVSSGGASDEGEGGGASGGGTTTGSPACPDTPPIEGSDCTEWGEGMECQIPQECGGWTAAACVNGAWSLEQVAVSCDGVCPPVMPEHGAACNHCCIEQCWYPTGAGCPDAEAFCGDDDTWQVAAAGCAAPPPCPEEPPAQGDACAQQGQECDYPPAACGEAGAFATCEGGHWQVGGYAEGCEPQCPDTLPQDGAACDPCCNGPCEYASDDGCPPIQADCGDDGAWSLLVPDCPPPP